MKPIQQALRDQGLKPRRDLGQHYLTDAGVVDDIIKAAQLGPRDTVVEVGAGPGILTPRLCEQAEQVIAIELDKTLISLLQERTADGGNLTIRQADILAVSPTDFPVPYQVVANLPYYITSAVLRHFLETENRPEAMTLTIQKEVAERICAKPPKMSVLAISVQLYGRPSIVRTIAKSSFWPAPEVDSAVLRIEGIGQDLGKTLGKVSEQDFFKVVRAGFVEKRKQLHNTLSRHLDLSGEDSRTLLEEVGIDPARRAETLTIPEWVTIAEAYER